MNKDEIKCTYKPGELDIENHMYAVQIDNRQGERYRLSKLRRILSRDYRLDIVEYYNIVVYGDINFKKYCDHCGTQVFIHHSIKYGYPTTCSRSCSASLHNLNLSKQGRNNFQDPEFIERHREISRQNGYLVGGWIRDKVIDHPFHDKDFQVQVGKMHSKRLKKLFESGENPYHQPSAQARIASSRVKGKNTNLYLKIWDEPINGEMYVKVGQTLDPIHRYRYPKYLLHVVLNNVNAKYVIDLECKIKIRFCDKATELFPYSKLPEVIKYIRNFKKKHNINDNNKVQRVCDIESDI